MAGPILYSTNPELAHRISVRYRGGLHVVWASESFDPLAAGSLSPQGLVGRSSSPRAIFEELWDDFDREDGHSPHLKRYRRIFRALAKSWFADGIVNDHEFAEICALLTPGSWKIWRPLLYVIPRAPLEAAGRLRHVAPAQRASHGPEYQIVDLRPHEFDILRWVPR